MLSVSVGRAVLTSRRGRCAGPATRHDGPVSLPTPTLPTARLRLRPFADQDAGDLFALHSDAHVLHYWDSPPWTDRTRAERFIAACRQVADDGTGARLAFEELDHHLAVFRAAPAPARAAMKEDFFADHGKVAEADRAARTPRR